MRLALPWPPSVNHYWRTNYQQKRTYVDTPGISFRVQVKKIFDSKKQTSFSKDRLQLTIKLYPPDRRRRDIDNILKATLDGLQKAGVYKDDNQVDKLVVTRQTVCKNDGRIIVTIKKL